MDVVLALVVRLRTRFVVGVVAILRMAREPLLLVEETVDFFLGSGRHGGERGADGGAADTFL